ncbi:hypothetical protein F2Q69_00002791 [Brassica cretica]|uniref:Maintenance of Photosystem II under High light 2 C-terminal domain-containing protein n=1 Tax=Brassica cretica TaxID=69181 RepID=A0A8S9NQE0_BRACR|nr:hypothetical protein F2Q69_00002791 [Brassica cretica]
MQRHHGNINKLDRFWLDVNISLLRPENKEGIADLTRLSQELKLGLQNLQNMVIYLDLVSYSGGYDFHHMIMEKLFSKIGMNFGDKVLLEGGVLMRVRWLTKVNQWFGTRTVSWVYDQLSCVWSRGELLEKVKQDRKKRIERRAVLNSAVNEKGYLQDLVYKFSKVGQAIENNDLEAACLVLGKGIDTGWLSASPEENTEVESGNI